MDKTKVNNKLNDSKKKSIGWSPILKNKGMKGTFVIVSDNKPDLEGDIMDKSLLKEWSSMSSIPLLVDHKNEMDGYVADVINLSYHEDGDYAFVTGVPEWLPGERAEKYKSIVESGARHMGTSIQAIGPFDTEEVSVGGKSFVNYKSANLLELTLTPIPVNQRGRAVQVAKSCSKLLKLDDNVMKKDFKKGNVKKGFDKDGAHTHMGESPFGEHAHPEVEESISSLWDFMFSVQDDVFLIRDMLDFFKKSKGVDSKMSESENKKVDVQPEGEKSEDESKEKNVSKDFDALVKKVDGLVASNDELVKTNEGLTKKIEVLENLKKAEDKDEEEDKKKADKKESSSQKSVKKENVGVDDVQTKDSSLDLKKKLSTKDFLGLKYE